MVRTAAFQAVNSGSIPDRVTFRNLKASDNFYVPLIIQSAEYPDSSAAGMNALQKGVGETGCFPVQEIIKNRRFLKIKYLDSLAVR